MTDADFAAGRWPGGQAPVPPGRPGGLARRLTARLLDGVLVTVLAWLLSVFAFDDHYPFLVTGLFSGVLTFGYFVLFETTGGATPAKRLLGLTVRGPGGAARPTAGQSAIRNAFTLLATLVPYLGGLLATLAYLVIAVTIKSSPTGQGIHDTLAGGTAVVRG